MHQHVTLASWNGPINKTKVWFNAVGSEIMLSLQCVFNISSLADSQERKGEYHRGLHDLDSSTISPL